MKQALLAVAFALAIAGCGGGGKSAHSTTPAVTQPAASTTSSTTSHGTGTVVTHGRFHYPPILVRNYMSSCVHSAGGGTKKRAYCACTLDKLSNNVSTRDFAEIGLSHGKIPPRIKRFMSAAIAACAGKL